jgi:hypothetical protein
MYPHKKKPSKALSKVSLNKFTNSLEIFSAERFQTKEALRPTFSIHIHSFSQQTTTNLPLTQSLPESPGDFFTKQLLLPSKTSKDEV